ncbi:hypothetical protein MAR_013896 [Mya arenaria]|uniref:Uncharacterized protein n=1 Tax=Mya arenaria TaxID=6604 RepID=A0ABY7G174_MYAAR|nr:hypothetical protein MAR_013896 [Mya arenaria]
MFGFRIEVIDMRFVNWRRYVYYRLSLKATGISICRGDQTGRKLGKWLSTNSPSAWLIRGATALNITAQSGVLC